MRNTCLLLALLIIIVVVWYCVNINKAWEVISDFQSGHEWTKGSAGGSVVDDASTHIEGETQSLRLTTTGATDTAVFVDRTGYWDFSDAEWQLLIKAEDYTKIQDGGIWLDFSDIASKDVFRLDATVEPRTLRTGEWEVITVTKANLRSTYGSPSWSNIQKIRIRINGTDAGTTNVWLGGLSWRKAPKNGVVSITFDDGWATDYKNACPILDSFGLKATSYVIADKIGKPNRMDISQLQELQNTHEWDISAHGSLDSTTLTEKELRDEFSTIKKVLQDNGLSRGSDHYALPMGRYNSLTQMVLKDYFKSARTIDIQQESIIPGDSYRLRVLNVFAWTDPVAVKEAIDKAVNNHSWLILVYHRVIPDKAMKAEEISLDNFTQNMSDIHDSGAKVMTVREVIEEGPNLY